VKRRSAEALTRKYRFMEINQEKRAASLKDKMPDIQKTLDTVQFLKTRKVVPLMLLPGLSGALMKFLARFRSYRDHL
jgi:hypothetical protein